MTQLEAALIARSYRESRAFRSANVRHRRLVNDPIAIVMFQLGAEPFTVAAMGFGAACNDLSLVVAGEPRNRDLAFAALLEFADWFVPRFEAPVMDQEPVRADRPDWTRATTAPQIIVPNRATIEHLGRLGRRLAYLPTDGRKPADPRLIRLGQHLLFLARHARVPGQQLLLAMTDVMSSHWITPQSDFERQSLPALDAFIAPPPGVHPFDAAAIAERATVGPAPDADDDERFEPLLTAFNDARGDAVARSVVLPLLQPIRDHYEPSVRRAWEILWRCLDRERIWPEASSVSRRWDDDRDAYTRHMEWVAQGGRRRTRQTVRQAAMTRRRLEDAHQRLSAEEALDDPLRMIPSLLDHKAVEGTVMAVDRDHRELATVQRVRRPLLTLESPDPCLIPVGRELWWTEAAGGTNWLLENVVSAAGGGSIVTLKLMTSRTLTLPDIGDVIVFSIHHHGKQWVQPLTQIIPWTHQPAEAEGAPEPLEEVA